MPALLKTVGLENGPGPAAALASLARALEPCGETLPMPTDHSFLSLWALEGKTRGRGGPPQNLKEEESHFLQKRLFAALLTARRPVPSSSRVPGSGTEAGETVNVMLPIDDCNKGVWLMTSP
jgi:hypothetical protein